MNRWVGGWVGGFYLDALGVIQCPPQMPSFRQQLGKP